MQTLEKCTYQVVSADSVFVAGRDISKMISENQINLANIPEIAIAYLRQNIPLSARINLKIKNPTQQTAAINRFEYEVLIKGNQLAEGLVNQEISIEPGDSTLVPVSLNANIYKILSNGKTMEEVLEFLRGGNDAATEKKGVLTLKIRPSIAIGDKLVKYPGFITIEKELSSKILF